jgi:SAM-dependent methyltransferase
VSGISEGYEEITVEQAAGLYGQLKDAWKDESIPEMQRAVADHELASYRTGKPSLPFDAFVHILRMIRDAHAPGMHGGKTLSLLEVGCASGYYLDVLRVSKLSAWYDYHGVDYSPALIELAHRRYPEDGDRFTVADALTLSSEDSAVRTWRESFDVVIESCCMLHVIDWRKVISECASRAGQWVVLHRVPVLYEQRTRHYRKLAYGVPCLETHFAVDELRRAIADLGLWVRFEHQLDRVGTKAVETWACERRIS